jgi:hypothetical protein
MKGPFALADLFTVTVGFREHQFRLARDLSKFYNCALANDLAKHMRRVIQRYGDDEAKVKVFITATVSFGDWPAGFIALAAVRETAALFGAGKPEAHWFIQNRTYVNDCIAGDNSYQMLLKIWPG